MNKILITILSGFCLTMTGSIAVSAGAAQSLVPSDIEIRNILIDRIDTQRQSIGIVVGVVDAKGRRIVSYGHLGQGDTRPLNGDTLFEIGSITKVFTSLLLSDMAQRGEVELDDPAGKYLPPSVRMPARGTKEITLANLAMHTSGLPRLPDNIMPANLDNPYADYTVEQLYSFLNGYTLPRDAGAQREYSNLGGGLLGHVLSLRVGRPYEALVRERITEPLGMKDTTIALSPAMGARLAIGHGPLMQPVENWDLPTLPGAGALRSTTNDMLTFLAAQLGFTDTTLKAAMAAQLAGPRPTPIPTTASTLGWAVLSDPAGTVIWHTGGTGGYRSFIGFNAAAGTGVAVLSNAGTVAGIDDIGFHLLLGKPLAKPR